MTRVSERLIDVLVLAMLLTFGWAMREIQPALAGVITAAAVQFWLQKNATVPHVISPSIEQAAATAAAEVLRVAREKASTDTDPDQVEIVGSVDVITPPPPPRSRPPRAPSSG